MQTAAQRVQRLWKQRATAKLGDLMNAIEIMIGALNDVHTRGEIGRDKYKTDMKALHSKATDIVQHLPVNTPKADRTKYTSIRDRALRLLVKSTSYRSKKY
jgi:hypothetical protein